MSNNSFSKQLIISDERYNHILKKDAWHEMEIKAIFKTDSSIYELLRAAIAARTLTPFALADIGEGYIYVFRSQDVIEWGRLKGYSIPDEYAPIKKPKKPTDKNRTRKTNLIRAVEAAIEAIGGKPSFPELWQYFQDNKDTTGFIEDFTDTRITWIDTENNLHDTQKETLANSYSRLNR